MARFDRAERAVHWTNALLFAVLFATAIALYVGPVSAWIGRRELVKAVHVWAGLALPVPLLLGLAGRWRRALLADIRRFDRWDAEDRQWFRTGRSASLGKFNPGQKLNAAFVAGAVVVMLATGAIMKWFKPFPLSWRTGATLTHDLLAFVLLIAIVGHVALALRDLDTLRAMVRGWVPRAWAEKHAPRWLEEVE